MKLKGELKFQGVVDNVDKRLKRGDFLAIDGIGLGYKLWDALLTKDYENVIGKTIIEDAIALTDLTDNNVDPDDEIATTFTREYFKVPVFKVIEEICKSSAKSTGEIGFDFYVDVEGDVHVFPWNKFASSVVAKRGDNVEGFRVKRLGFPIKNQIWVYGEASKILPPNDEWSESLDNWVADFGEVSLGSVTPKVGSKYIVARCDLVGDSLRRAIIHRTFPTLVSIPSRWGFWIQPRDYALDSWKIRAWKDASNYFELIDQASTPTNTWTWKEFNTGKTYEYDEDKNPEGIWNKVGSPSWRLIAGIQYYIEVYSAFPSYTWIDGILFDGLRWEGFAEDSGAGSSQEKYGIKPLEPLFIDELTSDAQCLIVAQEELKRRKDPRRVIEVDVVPVDLSLRQGDKTRVIDDKVHQIDEYARVLEVSHVLGSPFKSVLTLSTEIPSFAPEFAKVFEKISRLERRD